MFNKTTNIIAILILLMVSLGCSNNNNFSYKQECAKYNTTEKSRMEKAWKGKTGIMTFGGMYYSKTMETCVSEWFVYGLGESRLNEMYIFTDVLTEVQLARFNTADIELNSPLQKSNNNRVEKYREELNLVQ